MDWLVGTVVGAVVGFASALGVTECTRWRERASRKKDMARLLRHEIAFNKGLVRLVEAGIEKSKEKGQIKPHLFQPFPREIFGGSVGELALLPEQAREMVLQFYAYLHGLDFIQVEGYLRQTMLPPGEERPLEQSWAWVQGELLKGLKAARQAGDEALAALDKVLG